MIPFGSDLVSEGLMAGQPGFFDLEDRLAALSVAGDPLERLSAAVDFEIFRPALKRALRRSDRSKGGRPPYNPVLMFKILVLQALYGLSDEQAEYQIRDRLSFMRFLGLGLGARVPDEKTIWLFREILVRAGAIQTEPCHPSSEGDGIRKPSPWRGFRGCPPP